ncbi:phage tail protein [Kribbella sp. WER1]
MSNIGYATLQIIPSLKGVAASIQNQMGGGDVASAGKKSGVSVGGAVMAGVKTALKATVAGGALFAGIAAKKGIDRLLNIEDARAKLQGLGHDTKTVDAIMKNALNSVKGTAFGLDEAAKTAAGAVASGVQPGKDLERTLKLVGDAATIGGTSMGEMGAIFNKVAASGKIQGDVIAQLGDRGIPILQLLGKELGKTPAEVAKLASQGKVDFATFQNAMEKGLGGAALKSGETTRGAFKNMMASIGRIGANFLSGVFPLFQKGFVGITNLLGPVEDKAKQLGAVLGTAFSKLGSLLKPVLTEIVGGFRAFGAAWKAFDGDITSSGFPGFMEKLAFISRTVFTEIVGGVRAFIASWKIFDGDVTSSGFPGFMEKAAFQARTMFEALKAGFTQTAAFVKQHETLFKSLAAAVAGGALAFKAFSIAQGVVNNVTGAVKAFTLAARAMSIALSANPIGIVVVALGALVAGLIYAYRNSTVFRNIVNGALKTVMSVASQVGSFIKTTFGPAWASLTQAITTSLLPALQNLWSVFKAKVLPAIVQVIGVVGKFYAGVLSVAVAILSKVGPPILKFAAWLAINLVKSIIGTITVVVKIVAAIIRFGTTLVSAAVSVGKFAATVASKIAAVVGFFLALPGKVLSAVGNMAALLVRKGTELVTGLLNGAKNGLTSALHFMSGIGHSLSSAVGNLGSLLYNAGSQIVQGLANGIRNGASAAISAAGDVASSVLNKAKSVLGIHSPSREFAKIGDFINQGFKAGLNGSSSQVTAAVTSLMTKVRDIGFTYADTKASIQKQIASYNAAIAKQQAKIKPITKGMTKAQVAAVKKSNAAAAASIADLQKKIAASRGELNKLNALIGKIGTASGRQAFSRSIAGQYNQLLSIVKQREAVAVKLEAAKKQLTDAITLRDDFRKAVTDSALAFNNITNISANGGTLKAKNILKGMQSTLQKTLDFAANLAKLKASGLRDDLYKQIADAGVDAGGDTAKALVKGGAEAVAQANDLQRQIANASAGLGNTAATNLYQAGVDAAQGLVNGLTAQAKQLDAAATKLANALVAAVKKALGIHSPSRVLAKLGAYSGQGFVIGLQGEIANVNKAGAGLGDAVVSGASLPVRSASLSGALPARPGGSGARGDVYVSVDGAGDPAATARETGRILARKAV